ncbi:hypothetical protein, partial [Alteromonas sp.]|uniref:hypothetical protein n=1 Tax=Alteromonas sp. TaxID=232 RepID=UPI00257BA754
IAIRWSTRGDDLMTGTRVVNTYQGSPNLVRLCTSPCQVCLEIVKQKYLIFRWKTRKTGY